MDLTQLANLGELIGAGFAAVFGGATVIASDSRSPGASSAGRLLRD